VVEAQVGVRVDPARCTPERLRRAVLRVLHDVSYRRRAQALAARLARYGGADRAALLLERLGTGGVGGGRAGVET
jgi:UDP:flavonoid glycosyltransferase YjiC (YdhE family)